MNALVPHFPVLQVVIPMCIAPLIVLFRNKNIAWFLATLCAFIGFYISVDLLQTVRASGPIDYAIGNWPRHVGIIYHIDVASAYILTIISSIAIFVFPYAKKSVEKEIPEEKIHYFYAAMILCLTGLMGITATGDAFNVFVFLEISSLSTYALVAMGDKKGEPPLASLAAYRYLIMGTIGGTFILLGIGFLYMMTGTLNMAELSEKIPLVAETTTIRAAMAFITVGTSIKLALFPLHMWLPNTYTHAPSVVSAFLSSTATKVSYYVLLRMLFVLFGVSLAAQATHFKFIIAPMALIAIFLGSVNAIKQTNIKKLLAFSSVAQIGYMVLGFSFNNINGLTGGIVHLFNHALMKGGLFLVVGCMYYRMNSVDLKDLKGIGRLMPWTTLAFALGGLGLIGVPFTAGFISKWYLVLGALDADAWWIAGLILVASLLAVVYIFKVLEVAYFQEPEEGLSVKEAPISMLVPTYALILASIYFGINTDPMLSVAREVAEMFWNIGASQGGV
jgi:multicomponent Na+:H+ antiporter subunit D